MGDTLARPNNLKSIKQMINKWADVTTNVSELYILGDHVIESEWDSDCIDVSKNGSVGRGQMDGTVNWNVSLQSPDGSCKSGLCYMV